jgi:hypothetical protein
MIPGYDLLLISHPSTFLVPRNRTPMLQVKVQDPLGEAWGECYTEEWASDMLPKEASSGLGHGLLSEWFDLSFNTPQTAIARRSNSHESHAISRFVQRVLSGP